MKAALQVQHEKVALVAGKFESGCRLQKLFCSSVAVFWKMSKNSQSRQSRIDIFIEDERGSQ